MFHQLFDHKKEVALSYHDSQLVSTYSHPCIVFECDVDRTLQAAHDIDTVHPTHNQVPRGNHLEIALHKLMALQLHHILPGFSKNNQEDCNLLVAVHHSSM
jgi:hypothetical protein